MASSPSTRALPCLARRFIALMVVFVVVGACAGGTSSVRPSPSATTPGPGQVELVVLGAASLRDVLERAKSTYEAGHPGTTLLISTDSSAALAAQIEQGAPADLFLAADTASPERLSAAGLLAGGPVVFAGNRLAVVVPRGDPAGIRTPADLARPGVQIVAAGDQVPITRYATEFLDALAQEPGYPAGFHAAYEANVVSREDNVKAVVAKIQLAEGDVAIVYATDALAAAPDVETVPLPDGVEVRADYAGGVVAASRHPTEARALLDWLRGPDGRAILEAAGFLPPS